jgi:hypothetical protein
MAGLAKNHAAPTQQNAGAAVKAIEPKTARGY